MSDKALAVRDVGQEALTEAFRPREMIAAATEVAEALASVIERQKLVSLISGRKYVRVEGWTTLAALRGCLPSERDVQEQADGRYIAVVELVRADGRVLCAASAECGGPGEKMWQQRPPYARRSMAITRATGKVCRIAFSWVMVLAGYEATPAEEMEGLSQDEKPASNGEPAPRAKAKPAPKAKPASNGNGGPAATEPQLNALQALSCDERLPMEKRDAILNAMARPLTAKQAGALIGKARALLPKEREPGEDDGEDQNDPDAEPPWMRDTPPAEV